MSVVSFPKITLIIACKNAADKLPISLESIIKQSYPSKEIVVIDGCSTDNTAEILTHYQSHIDTVICESDSGISEAFNKGVAIATGEYLYFLGAGDTFLNPQSLMLLMEKVGSPLPDLIAGKVIMANADHSVKTIAPAVWPSAPQRVLLYKMIYPHQGLLMHRRYFERYGYFDTRLKYAMDYELLLRSYFDPIHVYLSDVQVAYWQDDGVGCGNIPAVLKEYDCIKRWHHLNHPIFLTGLHYWNLIKYYLKRIMSHNRRKTLFNPSSGF